LNRGIIPKVPPALPIQPWLLLMVCAYYDSMGHFWSTFNSILLLFW